KILSDFALPASPGLTVGNEIITNIGGDHDFVAIFRKRFGDVFLAQTVSVSIGGIERGDAQVERLVHERERLAFSVIPPPPGRDRPHSEADFTDGQVSVLVSAKFHRPQTT